MTMMIMIIVGQTVFNVTIRQQIRIHVYHTIRYRPQNTRTNAYNLPAAEHTTKDQWFIELKSHPLKLSLSALNAGNLCVDAFGACIAICPFLPFCRVFIFQHHRCGDLIHGE